MRTIHSKNPIPTSITYTNDPPGLLCEFDVCPVKTRLKAKVLVFNSTKRFHAFWKKTFEEPAGRSCLGIVSDLSHELIWFPKNKPEEHRWVVDPKYFALIVLVKGHLTSEIIAHEACHAAFALASRSQKKQWGRKDELDEEAICYPTGILTKAINNHLHKVKLL